MPPFLGSLSGSLRSLSAILLCRDMPGEEGGGSRAGPGCLKRRAVLPWHGGCSDGCCAESGPQSLSAAQASKGVQNPDLWGPEHPS